MPFNKSPAAEEANRIKLAQIEPVTDGSHQASLEEF